jgi:DNA-binding Xre family transcriptional regulator
VARDAGLAYNTVFAIYHNKAARVDLATLDALAGALEVEPGELIGWQGARSSRRGR